MPHVLVDSYRAVIAGMPLEPRELAKRAALEGEERGADVDVGIDAFAEYLRHADANDQLRKSVHLAVSRWDIAAESEAWTEGSTAHSKERRARIYQLLGLNAAARDVFDDLFPIEGAHEIVITDVFEPWYTAERRAQREFYWASYAQYLGDTRGWPPARVGALDEATTKVVERLTDPLRLQARQSKGLVVGYVQSGKTANYTGVIAKAVDAGYRLIIVLTGTVDLLREQTQRRLDMELVGKENILRGIDPSDPVLAPTVDYLNDDDDWEKKFVSLGGLPSNKNQPDIVRLTGHHFDYKSLKAGIVALEFERTDKTKPLYAEMNLPSSSARLAVVKKNASVLKKLLTDLKSIKTDLGEIPALIIDDESDQASVNTTNPEKWAGDRPTVIERTAINGLISGLLKLMPRAQYVGYTATPFANVFIDPGDVEDLFPKDFVISLERPDGYMGVADFHDIGNELDPEERTVENSNERAYVRDLFGGPQDNGELQGALDAFVLSGAVKLFREDRNDLDARHHTMLVHESVKQAEHAALAERIKTIWSQSGYGTPAGLVRLRDLYVKDFLPVSRARVEEGYSVAEEFDLLKPYIGMAVARITSNGAPVVIVNGDKDMSNEQLDFERRSIWRVLVGGTKLSRGFTIEGLTISYYRRKTKAADTLMQMGRWFGFRTGYKDLIRLYIGRAEVDGKSTVDLYAAFDAIVRDEEAFRAQLRQYAELKDGKPLVTPKDVPALVWQHLPWLKPASPNKMFNAELIVRKAPGTPQIPYAYPTTSKVAEDNYQAVLPLLAAATSLKTLMVPALSNVTSTTFDAFVGTLPGPTVVDALRQISWTRKDYFSPELAFLEEIRDQIQRWVIVVPQADAIRRDLPGVGLRSVARRQKRSDDIWREPTDRKHRPAIERLSGAIPSYGDPVIDSLCGADTAGLLIYPMAEDPDSLPDKPAEKQVVLAVAWTTPKALVGLSSPVLVFKPRDTTRLDAIVVDAPKTT